MAAGLAAYGNCTHVTAYSTLAAECAMWSKLHGSANWVKNPDKIYGFNRSDSLRIMKSCESWPTELCEHPSATARWLMVPPAVTKGSEYAQSLRPQWEGASRAIAEADMLWFIGYSFPETDSFMRYFLAASLCTNARIKQVVVVDPSRAACRRARRIFRLQSLKEVFHAVPIAWRLVNFQSLAAGNLESAVEWPTLLEMQNTHRLRRSL